MISIMQFAQLNDITLVEKEKSLNKDNTSLIPNKEKIPFTLSFILFTSSSKMTRKFYLI